MFLSEVLNMLETRKHTKIKYRKKEDTQIFVPSIMAECAMKSK